MAELLYRLGRFSARRARTVVAVWAAVLALSGAAYLVAGGTLASGFSIPDTPTAEVTERLESQFPEASGATGSAVMHTDDGAPFSAEQQAAIGDRIAAVAAVGGVLWWLIAAYADAPHRPLWAPAPWQAWVPLAVLPVLFIVIIAPAIIKMISQGSLGAFGG